MSEEEQKHLMQSYYDLHEKYYKLQQENKQLKERIDKAIEYINKHKIEWVDKKFEIHNVMVKFNEYTNPQALLEILEGE
jgi:hypothetical protein